MNPPPNASADSAPNKIKGWHSEVLHRRGFLALGESPWGEVICVETDGSFLFLSPLRQQDLFPLDLGGPASLRIIGRSGILAISGNLEGSKTIHLNSIQQETLRFRIGDDGVRRINRRQAYRVAVTLKAELAVLSGQSNLRTAPRQDKDRNDSRPQTPASGALAARFRPCVVRDLSLSGARISVASPAPALGELGLLRLILGSEPGDVLSDMPFAVIQRTETITPAPFEDMVRIRFHSLPAPVEGRLGRFLNRAQLEQLRTGIRG